MKLVKIFARSYPWEVSANVNEWMNENKETITIDDVKIENGDRGSTIAVIYHEIVQL